METFFNSMNVFSVEMAFPRDFAVKNSMKKVVFFLGTLPLPNQFFLLPTVSLAIAALTFSFPVRALFELRAGISIKCHSH